MDLACQPSSDSARSFSTPAEDASGSATAALFAATTVEDAVDNMAWAAGVGGAFGVGFLHEGARIDMAINPDWVLAGPQFLSGTPNPMFASVTARVEL